MPTGVLMSERNPLAASHCSARRVRTRSVVIQLTAAAMLLSCALWTPSSQAQDEIVPVPDLTGEFPGTRGQEDDWFGYEAPLQFGFQGGDTYVNPDWLFTVEHFRPIGNREIGNDEIITYVDARFGLGSERRAANFGAGVRHYSRWLNTIVDGNLWYDIDWSNANRFEQVTIGGQVQNEWMTARLHIYNPIGEEVQLSRFSSTSSVPVYVAQQLSFSRFRVDEVAYQGFDAEVGGILTTKWSESRIYGGIYHFEADTNVREIDGVSARVEQEMGAGWIASLGVTHDDVTDTSVMLRFTWEIGGVPRGYFGPSIKHRLAEAPRRNYNMVLRERTELDPLIATSAVTGHTINVIHTRSTPSGSGIQDGSFENPFTSLADASAATTATSSEDIILAHAGSVFDGQGIVLADDTRFLGDGVTHTVDTAEFGVVELPRANASTSRPIIQNSPAMGAAIQVASNVEVNNFDIRNAMGDGLVANAVDGDVLVTGVTIDGAADGVAIRNSASTADFTFESLSVANTTGQGIELTNSDSTVSFTGLTSIDSTAEAAFRVGGGSATVGVGRIQITNYQNRAVDLFQSEGLVTFSNPLILDNSMASLAETIRIQQSGGTVVFDDLTIHDTMLAMGAGIPSPTINLLSNPGTITFGSLTVTSANRKALSVINGSEFSDTLRIDSGTLSSANATALTLQNLSNMSITLQSVSSTNATNGIEIFDSGNIASNDVFRIIGSGTGAGTGGIISGVEVGVNIQDSEDVFINFLDITSSVAGIQVTNSNDINLNENLLQSTSADWVGIDLNSGFGFGIGGNNVVTNNTIAGSVGADQFGIDLRTDRSFPVEITLGGNDITLSGPTSTGINFEAVGVATSMGTLGDIELSSTGQDNGVVATVPFQATEVNGASINGQILINGTLQP